MASVLTEREREVLALAARGLYNKQIAHFLGISVFTVKSHIRSVCLKQGTHNRTQAVIHAIRAGLI